MTSQTAPEIVQLTSELSRITPELEQNASELERLTLGLERIAPELERLTSELEKITPELERIAPGLEQIPGGLAGGRTSLRRHGLRTTQPPGFLAPARNDGFGRAYQSGQFPSGAG